MHSQTVFLALVAAAGAVPLNINLGAYSPALVVGDGEISLGAGGAAGASELMATLAQGAQQGAAGGEGGAGQGQQSGEAGQGGEGQQGGETQSGEAQPGEAQPGEAQPGEQQQQEQPAEGEAEKRANLVRSVNDLLKREAAPQPEPVANAHLEAVAAATEWIKRDLNSFNAALSYAREAQKDSPKIELGSEGAGVGIVVNAGVNVPVNSAANGANPPGEVAERKAKRSEVVEESEAPKMTLVAITEV